MNPRKIITLMTVVFIIIGTLHLKSLRGPEIESTLEAQENMPTLLDLSAPG